MGVDFYLAPKKEPFKYTAETLSVRDFGLPDVAAGWVIWNTQYTTSNLMTAVESRDLAYKLHGGYWLEGDELELALKWDTYYAPNIGNWAVDLSLGAPIMLASQLAEELSNETDAFQTLDVFDAVEKALATKAALTEKNTTEYNAYLQHVKRSRLRIAGAVGGGIIGGAVVGAGTSLPAIALAEIVGVTASLGAAPAVVAAIVVVTAVLSAALIGYYVTKGCIALYNKFYASRIPRKELNELDIPDLIKVAKQLGVTSDLAKKPWKTWLKTFFVNDKSELIELKHLNGLDDRKKKQLLIDAIRVNSSTASIMEKFSLTELLELQKLETNNALNNSDQYRTAGTITGAAIGAAGGIGVTYVPGVNSIHSLVNPDTVYATSSLAGAMIFSKIFASIAMDLSTYRDLKSRWGFSMLKGALLIGLPLMIFAPQVFVPLVVLGFVIAGAVAFGTAIYERVQQLEAKEERAEAALRTLPSKPMEKTLDKLLHTDTNQTIFTKEDLTATLTGLSAHNRMVHQRADFKTHRNGFLSGLLNWVVNAYADNFFKYGRTYRKDNKKLSFAYVGGFILGVGAAIIIGSLKLIKDVVVTVIKAPLYIAKRAFVWATEPYVKHFRQVYNSDLSVGKKVVGYIASLITGTLAHVPILGTAVNDLVDHATRSTKITPYNPATNAQNAPEHMDKKIEPKVGFWRRAFKDTGRQLIGLLTIINPFAETTYMKKHANQEAKVKDSQKQTQTMLEVQELLRVFDAKDTFALEQVNGKYVLTIKSADGNIKVLNPQETVVAQLLENKLKQLLAQERQRVAKYNEKLAKNFQKLNDMPQMGNTPNLDANQKNKLKDRIYGAEPKTASAPAAAESAKKVQKAGPILTAYRKHIADIPNERERLIAKIESQLVKRDRALNTTDAIMRMPGSVTFKP